MAVQRNPQDQLAQTMLAMSLFSTQQFAEAAKAFEGLGDSVYRDPRMAYAWAFSLLRTNDPNKALEVLNKLSTQALPTDMMMGVGDLYSQTGDYEDALKVFRKVIQEDPTAQRAHYYAGEALIHLDRPNEAIPEFEDELKLTPDDPNVQYHLAYAMLQTSRKDEAVALLQKIVAAHPDHAQAQYQLGKALVGCRAERSGHRASGGGGASRSRSRLHSLPVAGGLSQGRPDRRRRQGTTGVPGDQGAAAGQGHSSAEAVEPDQDFQGTAQRRRLLSMASSSARMTCNACSGVTAKGASPRIASRTFW